MLFVKSNVYVIEHTFILLRNLPTFYFSPSSIRLVKSNFVAQDVVLVCVCDFVGVLSCVPSGKFKRVSGSRPFIVSGDKFQLLCGWPVACQNNRF